MLSENARFVKLDLQDAFLNTRSRYLIVISIFIFSFQPGLIILWLDFWLKKKKKAKDRSAVGLKKLIAFLYTLSVEKSLGRFFP